MLYYLFRFLEKFDIPGAHMWSYISFRALLTMVLSLLISAWFGARFIKFMSAATSPKPSATRASTHSAFRKKAYPRWVVSSS